MLVRLLLAFLVGALVAALLYGLLSVVSARLSKAFQPASQQIVIPAGRRIQT